MARPTSDPKPHVLSLRLGDADLLALDEVADDMSWSRSEAALAVLRAFFKRHAAADAKTRAPSWRRRRSR